MMVALISIVRVLKGYTVIRIEDLVDDEREELLRYATLIDALLAVELHKEAFLQIIWREARKRVELLTKGQAIQYGFS